MNEMIYGNTGKRDEGINIDMDQALYQKLQSRPFVPKWKSMLNDRLQEGDKNVVFVGEMVEKTGNFSVYGYNAKLENDSRGGDYGHYIAVPASTKAVSVNMQDIHFLTEESFVEYVNSRTINDDKRFQIIPQQMEIDINAKKRIVGALMETFMKTRKRKNVTFSFTDCAVEEFNAKALYVLCDVMNYLPYRMRKNVSFISHIASNQKLPDMTNLAGYPDASPFKPHDCIDLLSNETYESEGTFTKYVELVFGMSNDEREAYFEKMYLDIEIPALEKGVDVRSDLYLLDIETKEFWTSGDIDEVIEHIFKSVQDVLLIYPFYSELAKQRLSAEFEKMCEYVNNLILQTTNTGELKTIFDSVKAVFDACGMELDDAIVSMFKARATEFVEKANTDESLMGVVDNILEIGEVVLDKEAVSHRAKSNMRAKNNINGVYDLYVKLKDKAYVDGTELDACFKETIERVFAKAVENYPKAKGKVAVLERIYAEIKVKECSFIRDAYEMYHEKYSEDARQEAIDNANKKLYEIENNLRNARRFLDLSGCIIELSNVEVNLNENLNRRASDIYRKISKDLYEKIAFERFKYPDFVKVIEEISPVVKVLNSNGIYDNSLRNGWGQEKYVQDGLYKFVTIFEKLISRFKEVETLVEALLEIEYAVGQIDESDERNLCTMLEIYGVRIFYHWAKDNQKLITAKALRKAEKEIKKKHERSVSRITRRCFRESLEHIESKKAEKRRHKIAIVKWIAIIIVALAILGALAFGVIKVINWVIPQKPEETIETQIQLEMESGSENMGKTDAIPSEAPSATPAVEPTEAPIVQPTVEPTEAPTEQPTVAPTETPTEQPTAEAIEAENDTQESTPVE